MEDGNEPTELEVESWYRTIGHLDYSAAMDAAVEHFRYADLDHNGNPIRLKARHVVEACVEPVRSSSWAGNVTEQRIAQEAKGLRS